jgi:uncharacterized protein
MKTRFLKYILDGIYERLNVEKPLFTRAYYRIDRRCMDHIGSFYPPAGQCFPGKRKIFISVDGTFYMCERVGSNYAIGNVYDGFDYIRIYNFLKEYESFFKDCKNCWALRLCRKCFNNIRKGDKYDDRRRDAFCKYMISAIEEQLKDYCYIREERDEDMTPIFRTT